MSFCNNLKEKMADTICTNVKLKTGGDWELPFVIKGLDVAFTRRQKPGHPHSDRGRDFKKLSKTVTDSAREEGRTIPLHIVK